MISNQDKQSILDGAYGVSRKGHKCKFVGLINEVRSYTHMFVYFNTQGLIFNTENLNEDFKHHPEDESPQDVVGLWENRIEPFNLEKALQGEPVLLRNSKKAHLKFIMPKEYKGPYPVKGYVIDDGYPDGAYTLSWHLNGKATKEDCNNHLDIIGMYKESEPEPNTVTLTLPCPLKEPKDEMWFVDSDGVTRSNYHKNIPLDDFERIPYFGSKEDAQAWFDAMQNSGK